MARFKFERQILNIKSHTRELRKMASNTKSDLLKMLAQELVVQSDVIIKANEMLAQELVVQSDVIIKANERDLKKLDKKTSSAFRDRLMINSKRIEAMALSLRQVAELEDPVGEEVERKILPNQLLLRKVRAPFGVIFMIFESRPNVILEAFSLAYKSGNGIILRGGRESAYTAQAIYKIMYSVFKKCHQSPAFFGIEDYDRKLVNHLLKRKDVIDIVVPRGGEGLINFVQQNSQMPVIKNDRGLCHTFIDEDADLDMAVRIVKNAKTQRPSVCNALETVLVHKNCADEFLPRLYEATNSFRLEWHVDRPALKILMQLPDVKKSGRIKIAKDKDWDTEYLDYKMNCRVVADIQSAIKHIEKHGSKHSEAIVTKSEIHARIFQEEVDAAAVYWNASTRFTDGFEFGLGGELGISTQKLHVRGPVGLRELTTPRWIIDGKGQIRE